MSKVLRLVLWICVVSVAWAVEEKRATRVRTEINLPDIPGYVTLKCDFHMHTVFSDGLVWPTLRVEEAWREGLDAIALTDHVEYQPHKADVATNNHNRCFEIARPAGTDLGIIVLRGAEITRQMPPGHLNAIFLTNTTRLAVAEWQEAVQEARAQGAFLFWNHPGWERQLQEDKMVRWYPEHTELQQQGLLQGIEVVNGRSYYPEAHRWALEKKLTMMSNSDIHTAVTLDYHVHAGDHRPMTLVFAKERTAEAIKEALLQRRTAVYAGNRLIGEEKFLRPIFERSLHVKNPLVRIKDKQRVLVQITNLSDLDYSLLSDGEVEGVTFPNEVMFPARKTALLELRGTGSAAPNKHTLQLPFKVSNLLVAPDEPLRATLSLDVEFAR